MEYNEWRFWERGFHREFTGFRKKASVFREMPVLPKSGEMPVEEDPRLLVVKRVAASSDFTRAPKLQTLFLHITRNALAGRSDLLTEAKIGQHVFDRLPEYNRAEDSIVRAQMRLLRRKLDAYFAGQTNESIVITVPTGSYVPRFEARESVGIPTGAFESGIVPVKPPAKIRRWMWLAAVGAALVCGALGERLRAVVASGGTVSHPILSRLLDHRRPTLVVVQDTDLVALNVALETEIPLDEYQSGAYRRRLEDPALSDGQAEVLRFLDDHQYTSVGDVSIVRRLFQAAPDSWAQLQVVYPKHLHMRQLKQSNAILIGGGGANPWVQLFADRMQFRLRRAPGTRVNLVDNLHPRMGEQGTYTTEQYAYGILALLPQTDGEGKVLLMAGTSLEATEAAAELVISPESAERVVERLKRESGPQGFTSFQLLVRTARLGGTSTGPEIVASRVE